MNLKDALAQAARAEKKGQKTASGFTLKARTLEPPLRPPKVQDALGRFVPGTPGGPGRPKSFGGLIRDLTGDGEELVLHALGIMRGVVRVPDLHWPKDALTIEDAIPIERAPSIAEQQAARAWLADRGFGKSVERIEIAPGVPEVHVATLTALEADDARNYFKISRRLAGRVVEGVLVPPAGPAVAEAAAGGRGVDPEPARAGEEPAPAGPAGADPR